MLLRHAPAGSQRRQGGQQRHPRQGVARPTPRPSVSPSRTPARRSTPRSAALVKALDLEEDDDDADEENYGGVSWLYRHWDGIVLELSNSAVEDNTVKISFTALAKILGIEVAK